MIDNTDITCGYCDGCSKELPINMFSKSQVKKSFSVKQLFCKNCIKQNVYLHNINMNRSKNLDRSYNISSEQRKNLSRLLKQVGLNRK